MPGRLVNVEIPADDTARAREFYGSLFGGQFEASQGQFEYGTSQVRDHSGVAITNMEPGKRGIRVSFDVDDINASTAQPAPAQLRDLEDDAAQTCLDAIWPGPIADALCGLIHART